MLDKYLFTIMKGITARIKPNKGAPMIRSHRSFILCLRAALMQFEKDMYSDFADKGQT